MKYANIENLKRELSQAPVWTALSVKEMIDQLSTEIVRCKECKYRERCEQIVVFDIGENQVKGRKIDFCSYGERREP